MRPLDRSRILPALLAAALAGCAAHTVQREEENARFREEMLSRVDALKIDPAVPLTADRCVEIAIANNLDLRVRQLRLSLEDEKVKMALSGALPQGSLTYTQSYRNNKALTEVGGFQFEFQDQNMKSFSLPVILPILDWGATYYAYRMAQDRQQQQVLLLERTAQTLARDVRTAYARLAGAQRQEELARVGIIAARELLKVAQSYEREGIGSRAETAAVEATLARAALQWTQLRRGVEQARLVLAQTLSLPPGVPFRIDAALPPPRPLPKASEIAGFEESALRARPELLVQDLERRVAADEVHRQFAQMLPRVDAVFSFNWSTMSTAVNPSYFQYGFQVTDSLLNGGSQWWQYQMAGKNVDVEAERTMLLTLGVLFDVDFRALQLFAAYDAMKARETVVTAQHEALRQMVSRYVLGLETGNDTVFSLAQMYLARLELDQVQTEYQTAWIELETAALPGTPPPPPPEGEAPKPLPSFQVSPSLDTLQQILESAPPVDLRDYPELKKLMEAAGIGGTPGK